MQEWIVQALPPLKPLPPSKSFLQPKPNSLQKLYYTYDAVGNVTTIKDYLAAGGTQTQTFGYDALDRLAGATATGGSGGTYSESYAYNSTTGNLSSKGGVSYAYNDTAHKHAVTHLGGVQKYWYDANGNMITRIVGADTYSLTYDVENRLTQVKKNGAVVAAFTYDGDGQRVKSVVGATTTAFVGSYFEWTGSTSTMVKYYYAGSTRLAMRVGANAPSYLLGDYLGSTSITADGAGNKIAEVRYLPFGGQRYASGTTPTAYRFTGQREESSINLYWYNSRWYDPALGRWIQPDTIIPLGQGVQAFDRYAYVNNSPVVYNDPSGHCAICMIVLGVALVADFAYMGANAMGWIPDYVGIARAEAVMGRNGGSIEVAAGLAVQGEYSGYVDSFIGDVTSGSSGYGLAQTNAEEISALGLGDLDPNDPASAVLVMEARIAAVQGACVGCSPQDLLVAAALAQNRGITPDTMRALSVPEGDVDWGSFFSADRSNNQPDAQLREALTGMDYQTSFMLYLYIRDLRELYRRGWELPTGITEADLDYLEELAQSNGQSQ